MAEPVIQFSILVQDALQKAFWYKKSLRRFLERCGVPRGVMALCHEDDYKRDWLDAIFPVLEDTSQGLAVITKMAYQLREMDDFPDHNRKEDARDKKDAARRSVAALRRYMDRKEREKEDCKRSEKVRREARKRREANIKSRQTLESAKTSLYALLPKQGTSAGGYAFQDWFYDEFIPYWEIQARKPYTHGGRQMDGHLSVAGVNYVVELKFTSNQTDVREVDSLKAKVADKADNTMGLMLSMAGYSSVAVDKASGPRTTTLLMDYNHINLSLEAGADFSQTIERLYRHAGQTGEAYLPTNRFGG